MTNNSQRELEASLKQEHEAAELRQRRKYSDSEGVLSLYEIHSGVVHLLSLAARLAQKVKDAASELIRRTNEIEDKAYEKKRRQSGAARKYSRERPKPIVLTDAEMQTLFPPSRSEAKILRRNSKSAKRQLVSDSFHRAMDAIGKNQYPPGILPFEGYFTESKGIGKTTFTFYYGKDHPTQPQDNPADVEFLAEFLCDFHNTFLNIHKLNRDFTRWDVFATAARRPQKLWLIRGSSRHDVWLDLLSKSFGRQIWPILGDLDNSLYDLWPCSRNNESLLQLEHIREVIRRRYREGEPPTKWQDEEKDYILGRFYSSWHFPVRKYDHSDKLTVIYANLESEFLRAVDIQRNRDAMAMRLAPFEQSRLAAFATQPDGPMTGGLFWFNGKRATLSDIPWRLLKALFVARNWVLEVTHLELEVWGDAQEDTALKSAIHDVNNALTDAEIPLVVSKIRKQDVVRLYRSDQETKTA